MLRSELTDQLAEVARLSRHDADKIVSLILAAIASQLIAGGTVQFRGFGTFKTMTRNMRLGRNPKNGGSFSFQPKRYATFKPSPALVATLSAASARRRIDHHQP